ncbi:MAG: hypothetical protein ACI9Q3_001022 [Maribacter sp.]|jgi:hypothetical protein
MRKKKSSMMTYIKMVGLVLIGVMFSTKIAEQIGKVSPKAKELLDKSND